MPSGPKQSRLKDIREEEEEQDEADCQHIHEEQQHDAAMVQVPARLHAAEGVEHAEHGEHGGKDEQRRGTSVREIREAERRGEATVAALESAFVNA